MKVVSLSVLICLLSSALSGADAQYKILGILPTIGKSHFIFGNAVMESLADAEHEVTVISPFPRTKPRPHFRDISIADMAEDFDHAQFNAFEFGNSPFLEWYLLMSMGADLAEEFLSHPNVIKLMNSDEEFDAIIVESFMFDAVIGLGEHFNCPVIALGTFGAIKMLNQMTDNPSNTGLIVNPFLSLPDKMNYWQRFENTFYSMVESLMFKFLYFPAQRKIFNKHFPNSKASFDEQLKGISLVLINNFISSSSPRNYMPNMIEIGGIHVADRKELKNMDIKEFLDTAEHGVIYFSMGSFIQSTDWPEEKREAFVKAFARLDQRVIWKYENETLPNKPDNVMIGKWMPQRDILSHPNVKLFISHGGLLGTTEALVEAIPIIGIPVFGDQQINIFRVASQGYGLRLDFSNITEETVYDTIKEIIYNSKYKKAARLLSQRFKDRPQTPKKTAVFWIEYAIRHKGAAHLRFPVNLNTIEYHLIDVYAVMLLIALVGLYIDYRICKAILKRICRKFCSKTEPKSKPSKKQKKTD